MRCVPIFLMAAVATLPALAVEPAAPLSSLARLPVHEVTVFKDGHAFVLHQGPMPTDAAGNVLMDYLPTPVMGTFWPGCTDKNATLHSTTAGRRRVKVERTALTLRELIEANPGADVIITESNQKQTPATIVRMLSRSAEEVEKTAATAAEYLPQKGNLVLLKTVEGTRAVPIEQITDVKFLNKFETKVADEEYRNLLTMRLDWGGKQPEKTVEVGMAYLQKGMRWIPHYRVELDAKGKAVVKLQATLLNELTDLQDATVHLVVGVPTFQFKETTDPIALGQTLASLSPYFQDHAQTQHMLSNSMMTQVSRMGESRGNPGGGGAAAPDLGPPIDGDGKTEDLYIYTIKNVTLKKGQRLVVPVSQMTLDYKDVYVLEVSYVPPPELRRTVNDRQAAELMKMLHGPKVMYKVRLNNSSDQPLTTAPAMILKEGKLLSQGMMTYTARGAAVDLTVTHAVDVKVKKADKEVKRTPNAAMFEGNQYWRIDAEGTITLTNFKNQPVEVEVIRYVLGNVGEAGKEGHTEMINALEDDGYLLDARPVWWGYYSWPHWWHHFNGIGRITWNKRIEPGKSVELSYNWHYYWR